MNSKHRLRSRFILIVVLIAAGFLVSALYWMQIVKGSDYAAKADKQYAKPAVAQFDRGTIYFDSKDGTRVAAASIGSGYAAFMNPTQLTSASQAYEAVSQYLKLDKSDFLTRALKPNDHYETLADKLDSATAQSIKGLGIKGIGVAPDSWRSYPGGTMAAHVLGLIGEDADSTDVTGKYGLERFYEDVLSRPPVGNDSNVFAQLFGGLGSIFGGSSKEGDIVTTIEPTAQKYLERVLSETETQWHSDEIGGIVIDPKTGEIVAMSSLPSYDPNDTSSVKNVSIFSNPLIEHVYEMGSIIKPLTMAMALDTGAEKVTSTYNDTGTMTLDGKRIANYDGKPRGPATPMQQILSQSLNIGAATIAMKTEHDLGPGTMLKYFSAYGLGEKTGIDEPNEATGLITNLKPGVARDINIATAAYGQGIAISPIETARALSILANGGYLVMPHVVKEIDYTDGSTEQIQPTKSDPILKSQTAEEVTRMLIQVVDGTMAPAHPEISFQHYSIAAKTGTAQIPDHVNGGYYPDRYLHSFFGYFPAYDPKFLVFLYQVYPKGAEYASATLTVPFSEMAKFLINYYDVAPDR